MIRYPQEELQEHITDILENIEGDCDFSHIRFMLEDQYVPEPISDWCIKKALKQMIEDQLVERVKVKADNGRFRYNNYKLKVYA